jgi:RNA polymerase sigma-70 factor, ECF subfamily
LARDHTSALARVARAEGLDADDALDAIQEAFHTFLGLPQARSLVGSLEESRALMAVIVRNAARNLRRRSSRSRHYQPIEAAAEVEDETRSTEELIDLAEDHARLLGCVNRLAEIQRNVVSLRLFEEVTSAAVSETLRLEPGHVAVLLHRAKKRLRDCMAS